jgi:hypothetical protein
MATSLSHRAQTAPSPPWQRLPRLAAIIADYPKSRNRPGGRYLWFTDEVNGMAMYLYDETWFTEDGPTGALEMFTYWGDAKTDYGGTRFLR